MTSQSILIYSVVTLSLLCLYFLIRLIWANKSYFEQLSLNSELQAEKARLEAENEVQGETIDQHLEHIRDLNATIRHISRNNGPKGNA